MWSGAFSETSSRNTFRPQCNKSSSSWAADFCGTATGAGLDLSGVALASTPFCMGEVCWVGGGACWVGGGACWVGGGACWVGGRDLLGRRQGLLGWRWGLLGGRQDLLGGRQDLLGWRWGLLGGRSLWSRRGYDLRTPCLLFSDSLQEGAVIDPTLSILMEQLK